MFGMTASMHWCTKQQQAAEHETPPFHLQQLQATAPAIHAQPCHAAFL
jgi:hypothetical protein